MFYYIAQENIILLADKDRARLERTIVVRPQYKNLEIQQTSRKIVYYKGAFVFEDEIQDELLQDVKNEKIKENDLKRDTALNGGVLYKDILFDSDTDQKVNLLATVSTMPDEATITWFGMDNTPLECTKEDLINIGGLITELHSFCWEKNATIKHLIAEAETIEEVNDIVINYSNEESEV